MGGSTTVLPMAMPAGPGAVTPAALGRHQSATAAPPRNPSGEGPPLGAQRAVLSQRVYLWGGGRRRGLLCWA
eukprot:scaffold9606_cov45-Phaeocystis_antarctica.AAC.2